MEYKEYDVGDKPEGFDFQRNNKILLFVYN